jgi:hypothetical protein
MREWKDIKDSKGNIVQSKMEFGNFMISINVDNSECSCEGNPEFGWLFCFDSHILSESYYSNIKDLTEAKVH